MKWIRYGRGIILGGAMVVTSVTEGRFSTPRQTFGSVLFIVLGLALTVFLTWSAVRDARRTIRAEKLAATPVPESPDAGIGFFRREWEEKHHQAEQQRPVEPA
jgi:hypothetical protein